MKWDAKNISSVEGQSEKIRICPSGIGPIRLLAFFWGVGFFVALIDNVPELNVFGWVQWTSFFLSLSIVVLFNSVQLLRADGLSIFKPTRWGSRCLCDLADVTRIRKTGFGMLGYHFWILEYRFTIDKMKKVRFIPRKKGTEFKTFLGWVKKANPSVLIEE